MQRKTTDFFTHQQSVTQVVSSYSPQTSHKHTAHAVDQQLATAANVECCTECKKYVAIIFDEMYIKEDLVYNKHTNALIGFANLGDTNTQLLAFQKSLQVPVTHSPYTQFPCSKVTRDLLFQPFWEAVRRLEFLGFKVIAATADGVSTNRLFF